MLYQPILQKTPTYHPVPEMMPTGDFAGIQAIVYEGLPIGGQPTNVFAYLGFPADTTHPVPAVVLVHGGGGHAFLPWVKQWNDRGYAAIAMDNTGHFPTEVNAGKQEGCQCWEFGPGGIFAEEGLAAAPTNDGMSHADQPPEQQWMYHAVGQTILAANLLRADPRVDAEKIGITGVSWGGNITSLVIGYDPRFAFAVPIYGSGHLNEAHTYMQPLFSGKALELWQAEDRFDRVKFPVLWAAWNDDGCFSVNSNSKSFLDTLPGCADTRLSLRDRMFHAHYWAWEKPEPLQFADAVIFGAPMLTGFAEQPTGREIRCRLITDPRAGAVTARLMFLTGPIRYTRLNRYGFEDNHMDIEWQSRPLKIENGTVSGTVPPEATSYYIELVTDLDGTPSITSSAYIEL